MLCALPCSRDSWSGKLHSCHVRSEDELSGEPFFTGKWHLCRVVRREINEKTSQGEADDSFLFHLGLCKLGEGFWGNWGCFFSHPTCVSQAVAPLDAQYSSQQVLGLNSFMLSKSFLLQATRGK